MSETSIDLARLLNRGGLSAAPLSRLPLLSIFDDEHYENFDVDVISPLSRMRIVKILERAGHRLVSGSVLASPEGDRVVFPKLGILGSDPVRPVDDLLAAGSSIVLVTPTQALLVYLRRFGEAWEASLEEELADLVWEQPANLEKIRDRLQRQGPPERVFQRLRPRLQARQAEGTELRKRRRFRSRLPSRDSSLQHLRDEPSHATASVAPFGRACRPAGRRPEPQLARLAAVTLRRSAMIFFW